jgi:hypothetical protein
MSRSVRQTLALGGAVAAVVGAVLITTLTRGGVSLPASPGRVATLVRNGRTVAVGRATAQRTIKEASSGLRLTVSRYSSSAGTCLSVVVVSIGGGEEGRLGGCGDRGNPTLNWSIGGIQIGDQWFNVAYGEVSTIASSVRVILGNGRVMSFASANSGVWVVAIPGKPTDQATDIVRIQAVNATGGLIADQHPPSIVALRRDAQRLSGPEQEGS